MYYIVKENKKLNNDALDMEKYRNDLKWGKENGFIPHVDLPNWMKPDKNAKEHFQDEGK